MIRRSLLACLALVAAAPCAWAQQGLNPRLEDGLEQATDATIALSAGPEVGTGEFDLDRSEFFQEMSSSQVKLRIYVGPWVSLSEEELGSTGVDVTPEVFLPTAELPEVKIPKMRGFVFLNYGSNESRGDVSQLALRGPIILGTGLSPFAEVVITSASYRAGGGIRFDIYDWFSILPTFTVSYNYVLGRAAGSQLDIAYLKRDYGGILVDWRSESLTYIPELEFRFTYDLGPIQFRSTVYLSYLLTSVVSATSSFQRFTSHSYLGVLLLELDWNTEWDQFFGQDLHVIPTFRYTRVEGDAVAGLGTNDLFSVELGLLFDTTDTVPFASRLGIHARYIFAVDLRAWSIGVAHEF